MFVIVGEALLDMVQAVPGGPFVARPGGGPMNVAVGLRRLGHDTALMSRLSAGPLGAITMAHIAQNNLRMDWCVTTNDQTTLAFASLDDQHRAAYEFYVNGTADWGWTTEDLLFPPQAPGASHRLAVSVPPTERRRAAIEVEGAAVDR